MWVHFDMQGRAMRVTQGRPHLRNMPVSGAVRQHCSPDPKTRGADKSGTNKGSGGGR